MHAAHKEDTSPGDHDDAEEPVSRGWTDLLNVADCEARAGCMHGLPNAQKGQISAGNKGRYQSIVQAKLDDAAHSKRQVGRVSRTAFSSCQLLDHLFLAHSLAHWIVILSSRQADVLQANRNLVCSRRPSDCMWNRADDYRPILGRRRATNIQ